jgi:tetratricopeptide (TPR) repeat protein
METELSITAMPGPLISETTKPALPAMVSTDVKKVDGIPAGDTGEPETNRDDQVDTPDAALALDSDSTPVKVEEVGSKATGISQAVSLQVEEAASPSEAPEAVRSEVELSDDSADLAAAERPASDQQPVDGQLITDARPESIATTTEIRPDLIGRTLQQARSALSRGQYFQALADLESIWPVPDNRADFWLIKGSIHLGLGQLDLAEESFQLAHALVPGHAQTSVQLAVLKQEKGDHAGALSLLKDAARRHRDVPEIYLNLGYSQQALGEFAKAGRSFKIFLDVTEGRTVYSEQRKMVSQWVSRRPAEVGSIVDAR